MTIEDDLFTIMDALTFDVYDGDIPVDESQKVVTVPLPYAVFYSSTGEDHGERLCGRVSGRLVPFDVMSIGCTREQAQWAAQRVRNLLNRRKVGGSRIVHQNGTLVRKDEDYTRPGGGPLFYGTDTYEVAD